MDIVVSGIRPTGNLHLGNYFGAIKNFVKMQHENKCFFFIADYHSLTTHPIPEHLQDNIKQVLVEYLACGIDPDVATLYVQSDVPEVAELYLLLNMHSYVGELERCTSFKEKIRLQPNNINAGLLTYPTLMAADILLHTSQFRVQSSEFRAKSAPNAELRTINSLKVPVGKDQEQHLEMTRTFAKRFNRMHNVEYFPEPVAYNFGKELVKIPGLDGSGKMGKSEGNGIYLSDTPEAIRKKVMRAITDEGPKQMNQQKPEAIENLFTLMKVVSTQDTVKHFDDLYNKCGIRYGDMKKQLAEDIVKFIKPINEKIQELLKDDIYIKKVIKQGKEKAKESAAKTINEVRKIILGIR